MGVSNKVNNKSSFKHDRGYDTSTSFQEVPRLFNQDSNTRKKRSDSGEVSTHSRSETKLPDNAPIILTWVPKEKGRSLSDENLQIVIDHVNKYRETREILLCINSSGFESEQKEAIRQKLDERLGDKAQQVKVIDLLEYDWSSVDQGWKIDGKDISIKDYYANMYNKAPEERMYFPVELDNFRMAALALSKQITGKRGAIYVDFDTLSAIEKPLGQDITIPEGILVGGVDENFVNNDLIAIDSPEVVINFLNLYNYKIESEKTLCQRAKEILELDYDGKSLNDLLEMYARGDLNKALCFLFLEKGRFCVITHLEFSYYFQYLAKLQHDDPYYLAKSLSFKHNGGKYPDDSKAFHNYSWLDIPSRKIREEHLKIEEYISLAKKEEASKGIRALANYIQSMGYKFETEMTIFLHLAIRIQDKSLVKDLIEMGDDVNARDSHGKTPLHLASEMGDLSLVSLLLENGAVFNVRNAKSLTPKSLSKPGEVLTLLTNVEEAFQLANGGIPVIHLILLKHAVENLSDVQVLVKAKNGDGHTLLSLVVSRKSNLLEVQEKRLEIIDLLVDKGADINFKDAQGNSLLYTAISNTDKEVVGALLKKGAVIDDATKLIVKGMKAIPKPNEDVKAILEKLEQHTLDKLFSNSCSSSTQKRKKRQPCDNNNLEEAWKKVKDFLQKKVEPISELQAQLTRGESLVISAYEGIGLLVNNLRQGVVVDLEIAIDKYKHFSAFAEGVFIRHDKLQKEAEQDIDTIQRNVSLVKTGVEIHYSNQNDFDSIFNSIEQSLAGFNQKIEDYRTKIDRLGITISNFDSFISRTKAALPIFTEVKIISIRVSSRLEALPHNSNNRALLSLDHQRDIAELQRLRECIQRIQDVPKEVKSFLKNKIDEVNKKAAQLSGCLQSGGRRRRAAGGDCYTIPEDFNSMMSRNINEIQHSLADLRVRMQFIHHRITFTLQHVTVLDSLEQMHRRLVRNMDDTNKDLAISRSNLDNIMSNFRKLVDEAMHHEMVGGYVDHERLDAVEQEVRLENDNYDNTLQEMSPKLKDTKLLINRLEDTMKLVEEARSVKVRLDHYTKLLKGYYDNKTDSMSAQHGLQGIEKTIKRINSIGNVIHKELTNDISFNNQENADRGKKRIEQYQRLITFVIDSIGSDYSESLEFLNEKLPLEASQPIRDQITELKTVIESLKKLKGDLTDISSAALEDLPGKVNVLCGTTGAGRRKRAAGGGCDEITDESIESISRNLDNYMSERSTIMLNIIDATGSLLRGGSNAMKENIRDAKLLLELQNSYLDSVSSAIALHRSKNRHNGAVLDEEVEQQLNLLESKALEGRRKNADLMSNVTALEDSILAFEKIREIKERLNPKLLKDLSGEEINSLIDGELEKVEVVKKELARIVEGGLERTVRTSIKNKFEQEIQRVNKKVSDIQSFASLMQEIDRFDIRKKSLYESTRSMNSEGITYGKKINDLRDELFSNIVGLIDDFNNLKLDPDLIRQAPDFIKERVKVFESDISYLKSIKADVSTTKSFSMDELFDYISSSIQDYHANGESLELSQVAMSYKRLHAVAYFLENNFDINTRDSNGRTFLHLAAEMGSDEYLISLLLEKGAMFDAKDNDGKSPLDLLRANTIKLDTGGVELLGNIERAFHFVSMGDFDSVDNLLKESSEDYIRTLVKVRNSSGNTLLYEAVAKEQANQENQVKIIDLLIKNGAADGLQDPNGKSTLYVAIKNKGEKIIDFLLKKGAVVDGVTIEFAKQNSNEAIVKKLEKHVLGEFAQCSSGSSRVKREVGDCISWEDIDEFNEAEEQDRRSPEKIEIDSEKFLDYLKEVQGGKRSALLELVNKVGEEQVVGKFQDLVNKLTNNQKAMDHLNKVGRVSGALMHGMMYKSLLGASLRGDLKGVATSSGFIILSHVSGKISEAAYSKGAALMVDGKVLLGRLSKIGGSVAGHIFVPFMVYSAVEDGIACRKGDSNACVSLGGDVTFLATDAIGIGVEVAEAFGVIEGFSSVTGPLGAAIGVVVLIGTDIYLAVKKVDQEDKVIHLTGWERFTEGGRAFIGMNPDSKIQELMEEKEANNQLVQQGLEFLKNNTDIQASVFPTGKLVVVECHTVEHREETNWWCGNFPTTCGGGTASWIGKQRYLVTKSEKCTTKLQLDLDNTVNLFTKRTDIKWSRASPDGREDGGSFVCYPKGYYWSIPAHGAYLCENAIGVRSLTNGTGPIFVNLGEGTDDFIGSPNNPHIIIVEKGNKTLDAGRKDDLFMLSGSDISGRLDGRLGIDTLDLGNFVPGKELEVNLDNHYIKYQGISDNVLRAEGFENVLGRKEEAEKTYATCETQNVDGRGGKSDKESDLVVMDKKKHCSYKTQTAVRPFTYVKNYADNGTFGYIVNRGQGQANINLFGTAQHNFVFNYSLSEIESINKTQNRVTFSLGDLGAESRFNITILETKGEQNVSYYFSDNSKIVFEGRNIFALQNTNRSISELIDNYLPIVNRLGIYFSAQSGSESIVMAHKNNDVIESNPNGVTYLIGGDGKNVYVINPGSKLPLSRSKLPLPKVVIYYFDRENTGTATIDFRSVFREVYDKLCKHIEPKVMQGNVDLVLQLQCLDHGRDGGENYYISTVELKGGVSWYNRVHVMVENVPVKIEQLPSRRNHSEWTFTPSPLHFGKEYNIIYISTHDVLRNQKINTHRKVGEYKLLKDKDNLIITCEDKYSVIIENFFKNPVMQTLKVDFTDRRINLAEIDRSNITELNNMKDEYKKLIDKILNEHKESQNTITSNSTAPHRRERRDIIRVPRGFDIFSVALFRVFGIHREILLVPKKNDIMEVSLEEEMLPEELQQPSVSNNIPQSIEDRPLSKPIYGEKFLGEVQASAEEYSDVFEERSLASTTKLPLEIELQKKSNDKGSVYKENIPSSARKPESLINIAVRTFANAVKSATLGAAQLIPSLFKLALPSGPAQKEDFQSSDEKRNPSSEFRGQFSVEVCAQNNITALNVLLQNFLDRRYPLPQTHETTSEEAQAYAINITAEFEQILKCTAIRCGISVQNLDFNNWEIQSTIRIQALNNEKEEIFKTLCSVGEKACPNLTQRETFLTEIKNQLVRNLAPMSIADDKSWLEYTDIINLVKTKYGYNSENSGFLCNSKKVQQLFSVIGAGAQLTNTLKEFKTIGRKGEAERLTLIINTGDNHWVTLVVSHKTRECYYADSLCKNIPEDIRQSLSASGIKNVKNVSTLQQRDTYNCGIFALENTQTINLAIDHTRNPEKIKSAILQSICSPEEIGKIRSGRNSTNHAATNFYGAKDLPPNDTCANTPGSFLSGIKMTDYSNNLARR